MLVSQGHWQQIPDLPGFAFLTKLSSPPSVLHRYLFCADRNPELDNKVLKLLLLPLNKILECGLQGGSSQDQSRGAAPGPAHRGPAHRGSPTGVLCACPVRCGSDVFQGCYRGKLSLLAVSRGVLRCPSSGCSLVPVVERSSVCVRAESP